MQVKSDDMRRFVYLASLMISALLVSCNTKIDDDTQPDPQDTIKPAPKSLGAIKNISLDSFQSHQEVSLPRNVESEGAVVSVKDNSSWIRRIALSGDKLSFDVEENPSVSTGHRYDTLEIKVDNVRIGTICVSQARSRKASEKLAWCTSDASYFKKETPKVSGKELTKLIYNLEKTTQGADSYKNYPAFAFCIEMNHDPENDMEWHLPNFDETGDLRGDDHFTDGYYWTADGLRDTESAYVFKSNAAQTSRKKTEKMYVYAARNGVVLE